jgi:hypothetical protein
MNQVFEGMVNFYILTGIVVIAIALTYIAHKLSRKT